MLKNIPNCISPELLKILDEMGHGDYIVIADANFPGSNLNNKVIRADGISGPTILAAILKLINLDTYSESNFILMETTNNDPRPLIWDEYLKIANNIDPNVKNSFLSRFDFYDKAKHAYAIIQTGELSSYANIIIKKGVISN